MYDVAIVGAGPAALSAAINVIARGKKAVCLGRGMETSWLFTAEDVNNHLGFEHITGAALLERFLDHAKNSGVEIREGRVLQLMPLGEFFAVGFEQDIIEARRVIIATGIQKGPTIGGEAAYLGKGVSYCATCDGLLYREKNVFVYSDIPEGDEDVEFLANICKTVYYYQKKPSTHTFADNVILIEDSPEVIYGDERVLGVRTKNGKYKVEGVFIIKGSMPMENLVFGLEIEDGAIKVDRNMMTNIKGLYACGDCTGKPYQLSKAIGEGLIAGQHAAKN